MLESFNMNMIHLLYEWYDTIRIVGLIIIKCIWIGMNNLFNFFKISKIIK